MRFGNSRRYVLHEDPVAVKTPVMHLKFRPNAAFRVSG